MHGASAVNSLKSEGDAAELARSRSSNESEGSSKRQSTASGTEPVDDDHQRPQISFAPQVKRSDGLADQDLRVPAPRSRDEHIAILERQRNQEENNIVLRIPGPRDADAGVAPHSVDELDPTFRTISRQESALFKEEATERLNGDDHTDPPVPRRGITIAEPPRPSTLTDHVTEDAVAAKHTIGGALRLRRPHVFNQKSNDKDQNSDLHRTRSRVPTLHSLKTILTSHKDEGMPYLSWEATVGRNSAFVDLSEEQREELGGIEYRSLKSLALILVCYWVGFSIFSVVSILPWIFHHPSYGAVVTAAGQGRAWWAIFTANSVFNDLGFTLTPDSMISFRDAKWPLVLWSFLIIIGNTGFPIMLRIVIWVTSKWVPRESGIWEELKFLLDHPRRCFTLLFPSKATWALFWILLLLNGTDLLLFIILDVSHLHLICDIY